MCRLNGRIWTPVFYLMVKHVLIVMVLMYVLTEYYHMLVYICSE